MDTTSKLAWGGIDRLTVDLPGARNDYDRSCDVASKYATVIPVGVGSALILGGELSVDTAVWRARSGGVFIVQVPYSEPDVDEEAYLQALPEGVFGKALALTELSVTSGDMILFDSAEPGDDIKWTSISFRLDPGRYSVLTRIYDPNPDVSFILHEFLRVWDHQDMTDLSG